MKMADPELLPRRAEREDLADGGFILRSPVPLGDHPETLADVLRQQAEARPAAPFLRWRDGDGWQTLTYAEALQRANGIAGHLIDSGLTVDRPLMILSGNSIGHALVMLGSIVAGIPVVPVSPAYSLMSSDLAKLRHVAGLVEPGGIYVEAVAPFQAALDAVGADLPLLTADHVMNIQPVEQGPEASINGESIAKILFTSGSTGMPKGVINTHRMLCANQKMAMIGWPFVKARPPVLVDWLPWNHTFGGNMCFNIAMCNGGVLHIDEGKPAPGLIDLTVANLRLASPTLYFNVPAGFAALLPYLESDAALRDRFFRDLQVIMYAGAALPQDLWDRLIAVAEQSGHPQPVLVSAWGSTETAPMATQVHFHIPRAGNVGLPCAGVEVRFAPVGDKLELRVRGPNVTPGYYRDAAQTDAAFDEMGFYAMGDAGTLADPDDPASGVLFDGRVSEDFKLTTGTWVSTGALRTRLVAACAPLVQDAVICGHDRAELGVLLWPGPAAADLSASDLSAILSEMLAGWNVDNPGSSTAIRRFRLLSTPPSIDANEITDKGYVNQRAALSARADDVTALFEDAPGTHIPK